MSATLKRVLIFLGVLTGVFSANLGYLTLRENPTGWALLVLGLVSAAAGAIHLGVTMYRKTIRLDRRDASLWLLLPGAMVVGLGSPLEFLHLPEILPRSGLLQISGVIISGLGLLLIFFGGKLISHLPGYGDALSTPQLYPEFNRQQRLFMAAGLWLAAAGIGLGYSSWIGLTACVVLLLPGAILRHCLKTG